MSEKRDLNALREQWSEHVFVGTREEVLHFIDRAIAAEKEVENQKQDLYKLSKLAEIRFHEREAVEKERDGLIQALRDGFADNVQHPTKADLLYWITSTCPWLEDKFDETP